MSTRRRAAISSRTPAPRRETRGRSATVKPAPRGTGRHPRPPSRPAAQPGARPGHGWPRSPWQARTTARSSAWPAATKPAAALSSTASVSGPALHRASASTTSAFSGGVTAGERVEGRRASPSAAGRPGRRPPVEHGPHRRRVVVGSARRARRRRGRQRPTVPRRRERPRPSPARIRGVAAADDLGRTPAGLVSGPRKLKVVRMPSSRRGGPACRIAGWKAGAKQNVIPDARAGPPRPNVRVEVDPHAERLEHVGRAGLRVMARLPCFATGMPDAATTRAAVVEMLNVPLPSPPVPTTSIAPSGASTRERRARASPRRTRRARRPSRRASAGPSSSAASWAGVASPSMTAPIAARPRRASACRRRRSSPGRRGRRRSCGPPRGDAASARPAVANEPRRGIEAAGLPFAGQAEEVREQVRTLAASGRSRDGTGRLRAAGDVADAHDDPVDLAHGRDAQLRGSVAGSIASEW